MIGVTPEASVARALPASTGKQIRRINSTDAFHSELERHEALAESRCYCFSLILFDVCQDEPPTAAWTLAHALTARFRAVDVVGWHDENRLGVILPYCGSKTALRLAGDICHMVRDDVSATYTVEDHPCRLDPRPQCAACRVRAAETARLAQIEEEGRSALPLWKRAIDILGAAIGLIVLSPLFVVTGLFIKCVSRGPIFFRQERIGHMGRTFRLWKFRTYEHKADTSQHEKYVKSLIEAARQSKDAQQPSMRKLDRAPGIIPFGNLLRKSCIDEFPQLINVLVGQMSLVGPRPPIRYEVEQYDAWHKGRLCAVPGMTGLWQVSGKNRLSFNEMVRLDIQYLRQASPWLDLKILLKTPIAIFTQILDSLRERKGGKEQQRRTAA
ncbi:MAG: sugar transferase [Planctomycetes bacterium]|nr:sugar transferase [Planctomycetota bacterium]